MKTMLKMAGIGILSGWLLGTPRASADVSVSAGILINSQADFEAPLAASGTWVTVGTYGRCWHPMGVSVEWRPYCVGQWVWTDCGWYWESDEPWAWACYHYGCWAHNSEFGWVWIPGVEWAPAWVEWRVGGGFIGWAPCAPPGVVISPAYFGFVEDRHFREHVRPSTLLLNNQVILNKTTVVNSFRHEIHTIAGTPQRIAISEGPGAKALPSGGATKTAAVPIEVAARSATMPVLSAQSLDKTPVVPGQPPAGLPRDAHPKGISPGTPPAMGQVAPTPSRRHWWWGGTRSGLPAQPAVTPLASPKDGGMGGRDNGPGSKDGGHGNDKS